MKNSTTQTSSAGVVSAEKTYDAFGNVVSASGVWKSQFGYAGKFGYQSDPDIGLKLLGHRYYDSDTGRFLTRDPIKDGRNWYSYCENNPVNRIDPNGLEYHDPSQTEVDQAFKGTVIAFGDLPGRIDPITKKWRHWKDSDGWRDVVVPSGYATNPSMDVDLIIVIDERGNARIYFIPGNIKGTGSSKYRVNADGSVSIVNGYIPATPIVWPFWLSVWDGWIAEADKTGFPIKEFPMVEAG